MQQPVHLQLAPRWKTENRKGADQEGQMAVFYFEKHHG